jgi:hypothetical protein
MSNLIAFLFLGALGSAAAAVFYARQNEMSLLPHIKLPPVNVVPPLISIVPVPVPVPVPVQVSAPLPTPPRIAIVPDRTTFVPLPHLYRNRYAF